MWQLKHPRKRPAPPAIPAESLGAAGWARTALGFHPDALQARVLETHAKRGILNCSRQWGKSTVTAVKAVHQACHQAGSLTLVVSPSSRQSGEFIRKGAGFARKMGLATSVRLPG